MSPKKRNGFFKKKKKIKNSALHSTKAVPTELKPTDADDESPKAALPFACFFTADGYEKYSHSNTLLRGRMAELSHFTGFNLPWVFAPSTLDVPPQPPQVQQYLHECLLRKEGKIPDAYATMMQRINDDNGAASTETGPVLPLPPAVSKASSNGPAPYIPPAAKGLTTPHLTTPSAVLTNTNSAPTFEQLLHATTEAAPLPSPPRASARQSWLASLADVHDGQKLNNWRPLCDPLTAGPLCSLFPRLRPPQDASRLTDVDHAHFASLHQRFAPLLLSGVAPPQNADWFRYQEIQRRALPEQTAFLAESQKVSETNVSGRASLAYVPEYVGRYMQDMKRAKEQRLRSMPAKYTRLAVVDMSADRAAASVAVRFELKLVLLETGTIPRILLSDLDAKLAANRSYERIAERYPTEAGKPLSKKEVNSDPNAPRLAAKHSLPIVISLESLTLLVCAMLEPHRQWDVPVRVVSDAARATIYIDTPLPATNQLEREASAHYHMLVLKSAALHPAHPLAEALGGKVPGSGGGDAESSETTTMSTDGAEACASQGLPEVARGGGRPLTSPVDEPDDLSPDDDDDGDQLVIDEEVSAESSAGFVSPRRSLRHLSSEKTALSMEYESPAHVQNLATSQLPTTSQHPAAFQASTSLTSQSNSSIDTEDNTAEQRPTRRTSPRRPPPSYLSRQAKLVEQLSASLAAPPVREEVTESVSEIGNERKTRQSSGTCLDLGLADIVTSEADPVEALAKTEAASTGLAPTSTRPKPVRRVSRAAVKNDATEQGKKNPAATSEGGITSLDSILADQSLLISEARPPPAAKKARITSEQRSKASDTDVDDYEAPARGNLCYAHWALTPGDKAGASSGSKAGADASSGNKAVAGSGDKAPEEVATVDVLVRYSIHGVHRATKNNPIERVCLSNRVEYQLSQGYEQSTAWELMAEYISMLIRGSTLSRVHVNAFNSQFVATEFFSNPADLIPPNSFLAQSFQRGIRTLRSVLAKLRDVATEPGSYLLSHACNETVCRILHHVPGSAKSSYDALVSNLHVGAEKLATQRASPWRPIDCTRLPPGVDRLPATFKRETFKRDIGGGRGRGGGGRGGARGGSGHRVGGSGHRGGGGGQRGGGSGQRGCARKRQAAA